jgi:hypothetical protein
VLFETIVEFSEYDGPRTHDEYHQLLQCGGCEVIRYHRFSLPFDVYDLEAAYDDALFPGADPNAQKHAVMDVEEGSDVIPELVWKMYQETIDCFNAKANTLAAAGLRATVEAICTHQQINAKNLEKKIDGLVQAGVLAQKQADHLHEERYLGNEAVHEMRTPRKQDLLDGLRIVEGLLNTLYVLPTHADRLKARRNTASKAAAKTAPKSSK